MKAILPFVKGKADGSKANALVKKIWKLKARRKAFGLFATKVRRTNEPKLCGGVIICSEI